ncbi:MAG: DNA-processing protein DprA [Streptococcus mitis]|nr:DNA-processing protein DprA [Streptococcus mitis]
MKITNYEIYKLKKSGLTNQQILKVLEYGENVDQELLLGDIADISGCRNPAVFMERYFQIDDAHLEKEFQKFPSFSILDDCYPWDLSEIEKVIQGLENELVIVSGLAKGIDTAAHMAALQNGGKTIAVIGTGLDVFYPKANKRLQNYIGNDHLVLSEYGPGEKPLKFHFPARNRIIAGLCRGVIVAEAKMRSGSLITCERAMEEGRDVFAIPGSILDGLSDGCHHLIQEGAKLVTSGKDVLAEFEF